MSCGINYHFFTVEDLWTVVWPEIIWLSNAISVLFTQLWKKRNSWQFFNDHAKWHKNDFSWLKEVVHCLRKTQLSTGWENCSGYWADLCLTVVELLSLSKTFTEFTNPLCANWKNERDFARHERLWFPPVRWRIISLVMLAKTARGEEIIVKCKSELHALYCTSKDFTPATFYIN